ncbi:hypothetical protein MLD38_029730 [Melastoma candidum]|uniref:Uncharacterized protein n=1 Tax=Melastoma candidum TaxID=119954 RepID=A0ACB9N6L5_9MYRT|nr:hypothetical protein MLD38_029730 [Melastoma candidum]
MGRLFLVEFDDLDSGKFYVCQGCSTPFAKNTDIFHYCNAPGDLVEEIILFSDTKKISNTVDSEVLHAAHDTQEDHDWQALHCVACNNPVGVKVTLTEPEPFVFYSLYSKRLLFRMSGIEDDPEIFTPEEWFDPHRPSCELL